MKPANSKICYPKRVTISTADEYHTVYTDLELSILVV